MEIGQHNSLIHYSVIGTATCFYVWVRELNGEGSASKFIKGNIAFREYNKLEKLYKENKGQFIILVKSLHSKYSPQKRK